MVHKVQIEPASCCCRAPRAILLTWSCIKLIFDILVLIWSGFLLVLWLMVLIFYPSKSEAAQVFIYAMYFVLWIIDLSFNSMLVHGIRKKSTELLKKYRTYTYVLWAIIPVLGFVYTIFSLNNVFDLVYQWDPEFKDTAFPQVCAMAVSLVLQTFVLIPLCNEIKRLDTMKDFTDSDQENVVHDKTVGLNVQFTKIETSKDEEVADEDIPEERIDTSYDKAQLID